MKFQLNLNTSGKKWQTGRKEEGGIDLSNIGTRDVDHVCRVGDPLQENEVISGNGGIGIKYSNQKDSWDLLVVEEE